MKKEAVPRVLYCGSEDSLFKKLKQHEKDFVLVACSPNFNSSPQNLARKKKASGLILRIKTDLDLRHQEWLSRNDATTPVIVLCQKMTIETAIQVLQYGIYDYFCLTPGLDFIAEKIQEAISCKPLKPLKRSLEGSWDLLHGENPEIVRINQRARDLALNNKPVVLYGEPGTGKEHLAYGMYRLAARTAVPFIRYDCRLLQQISRYDGIAVPGLVHQGAREIWKRYHQGVLFLSHLEHLDSEQRDEILEQGARSSVKFIASYQEPASALFDNLEETDVPSLHIPALRQHREDIPALAEHFIRQTARKKKIRIKALSSEVIHLMQEYSWPGNVQELSNLIERMMSIEHSPILSGHSWRISQGYAFGWNPDVHNPLSELIEEVLQSLEGEWQKEGLYHQFMDHMSRMLIDLVLPKVGHNQAIAARILGISRNTLRKKLKNAG